MLDLVLSALGELRSPFALYESDIHQTVENQLRKARLPYLHEAKIGPGCRIDYLAGRMWASGKDRCPGTPPVRAWPRWWSLRPEA